MDAVAVQGEDVSPTDITPEKGWLECYRRRGNRALQSFRESAPSNNQVNTPASRSLSRTLPRLPPLPREHIKIIFRPHGGMNVARTGSANLRDAILTAANISAAEASADIFRLNSEKNILVLSTPSITRAGQYNSITAIHIDSQDFQLSPYVATPEGTSKGVIHGIPAYDTPEAITASIVTPANPKALQARRMGTTSTAIIVFDGYKVPPYIYYRGAEYRCYIHRQKMEACLACGDKGHRADVCPRPNPTRCRRCGDHLVETSSHTCEPKCTLCGGAHPLGDRSCKQRFKATPPRGKTTSLRKQWREDSAALSSPPEVTTKTPPASHEQHPPASQDRRASAASAAATPGDTNQEKKKASSRPSKWVNWAAAAASNSSSPSNELVELKQLLNQVLEENEKLRAEIKQLKTSPPPPSESDNSAVMDSDNPPSFHSTPPNPPHIGSSTPYITKQDLENCIQTITETITSKLATEYEPFFNLVTKLTSQVAALEERLLTVESRPTTKKASKPYDRPSTSQITDHGNC